MGTPSPSLFTFRGNHYIFGHILSLLLGPCGPTPSNLLSLDLFCVLSFGSLWVVAWLCLNSCCVLLLLTVAWVICHFTLHSTTFSTTSFASVYSMSSMCPPPLHSFHQPPQAAPAGNNGRQVEIWYSQDWAWILYDIVAFQSMVLVCMVSLGMPDRVRSTPAVRRQSSATVQPWP